MPNLSTLHRRQRLERAALHIHLLGPRATAEAIAELASMVDDEPRVMSALGAFQRLTPGMLRAVGGDRFPRRLSLVPQ